MAILSKILLRFKYLKNHISIIAAIISFIYLFSAVDLAS